MKCKKLQVAGANVSIAEKEELKESTNSDGDDKADPLTANCDLVGSKRATYCRTQPSHRNESEVNHATPAGKDSRVDTSLSCLPDLSKCNARATGAPAKSRKLPPICGSVTPTQGHVTPNRPKKHQQQPHSQLPQQQHQHQQYHVTQTPDVVLPPMVNHRNQTYINLEITTTRLTRKQLKNSPDTSINNHSNILHANTIGWYTVLFVLLSDTINTSRIIPPQKVNIAVEIFE